MPHVEESEKTALLSQKLASQGITSEALAASEDIRKVAPYTPGLPGDAGIERGIGLMDTRDTLERDQLHGGTAFPETIQDADAGFGMSPADIHAAGTAGTMSPAAYRMHRERLLAEQSARRSAPQTRPAASESDIQRAREEHLQPGGRGDRDPVQPSQEERDARRERERQASLARLEERNERRKAAGLPPMPVPDHLAQSPEERRAERLAEQMAVIEARERIREQKAEEARRRRYSRGDVGREILRREDEQRRQQEAQAAEREVMEQEQQQEAIEQQQEQVEQRQQRSQDIHQSLSKGDYPGIVDEDGYFTSGYPRMEGQRYADLSPERQAVVVADLLAREQQRQQEIERRMSGETAATAPQTSIPLPEEGETATGQPAATSRPTAEMPPPKELAERLPDTMAPTSKGQGLSDAQYLRIGDHLRDTGVLRPGMTQDEIQDIIYAVAKEAGYDPEGGQ